MVIITPHTLDSPLTEASVALIELLFYNQDVGGHERVQRNASPVEVTPPPHPTPEKCSFHNKLKNMRCFLWFE